MTEQANEQNEQIYDESDPYRSGVIVMEVTNVTPEDIERGHYYFPSDSTKRVTVAASEKRFLTSHIGLEAEEVDTDPADSDPRFSFTKDQFQDVDNRTPGSFGDWETPTVPEGAALPALKHGRMAEMRLERGAAERAAELGVDLLGVSGTGEDGLLTIRDVEDAFGRIVEPRGEASVKTGQGRQPAMSLDPDDVEDGEANPPLSVEASVPPDQIQEIVRRELGGEHVPTPQEIGGWQAIAAMDEHEREQQQAVTDHELGEGRSGELHEEDEAEADVQEGDDREPGVDLTLAEQVGPDSEEEKPDHEAGSHPSGPDAPGEAAGSGSADSPSATDAARQYAEENDVDLNDVQGSGNDGQITKSDVRAYVNRDDK